MKELEQIVKESFREFEPDVNPGVWERLEHNLNGVQPPANTTPAAEGGKGLIKTLASKSGGWIAGSIAAVAVTTAVLVNINSDRSPVVKQPSAAVQTTSETAQTVIKDVPADAAQTKHFEQSVEPVVSEKQSSIENAGAASSGSAPSPEKPHQETVHETAKTVTPTTTPAPVNRQEQVVAPVQHEPQQQLHEQQAVKEDEVQPVIIVSSEYGFAPLKVIALMNREHISGTWDFGDGYSAAASNTATHSYDKAGSYEVTFSNRDITVTKKIDVIGTISTAFTPNGDGVNDEFYIDAPILEEVKMKIFDRTGHVAYEITSATQRWNGKNFNGDDLPSGTYFYDIFARSADGKTINQKGTINIFR